MTADRLIRQDIPDTLHLLVDFEIEDGETLCFTDYDDEVVTAQATYMPWAFRRVKFPNAKDRETPVLEFSMANMGSEMMKEIRAISGSTKKIDLSARLAFSSNVNVSLFAQTGFQSSGGLDWTLSAVTIRGVPWSLDHSAGKLTFNMRDFPLLGSA